MTPPTKKRTNPPHSLPLTVQIRLSVPAPDIVVDNLSQFEKLPPRTKAPLDWVQREPGCYAFVDATSGTVLYVGKAASLRSRLQQYMFDSGYSGDEFKDERMKWRWINERADKVAVWIWKCPNPLNALLELALISVFQPELNSRDVKDNLLDSDSITILE